MCVVLLCVSCFCWVVLSCFWLFEVLGFICGSFSTSCLVPTLDICNWFVLLVGVVVLYLVVLVLRKLLWPCAM